MNSVIRKPVSVRLISWAFIAVGIFASYSVAASLMLGPRGDGVVRSQLWPGPPKWSDKVVDWPRSFPGVSMTARTLLSAFALTAGIQFYRLRSWARTALEVLSRLYLAYVAAIFTCSVVSFVWWKLSGFGLELWHAAVLLVYYGVTVLACLPGVAIIKSLRGERVRQALVKLKDAA